MDLRVVVLGAGFGGLELSSMLSEALAERVDLTLIDKSESFSFGFSKLDVMFGYKTADSVRLAYRNIAKPGVRFRQETITAIDPDERRVTTDKGAYNADVLVVALGADYDLSATPGLVEGGNEFFPNRTIRLLDPSRHVVVLDDETEMPYDLFLGVPKHRVPDVVSESGLAEDGWIPVDPDNLKMKFPACTPWAM